MQHSSRASNQDLARQHSNDSNRSNARNLNNSNSIINPLPTLHLHGLRREEAIRCVTDWLEGRQNETGFVRIVTGPQSGPVLRAAIQELLMARQMIFTMDLEGESFCIDPRSGNRFCPPPLTETDSDVIVVGTLIDYNVNGIISIDTKPTSLVASMPPAASASMPRRHVSLSGVPAVPSLSSLHHHHHHKPQSHPVATHNSEALVKRRASASTIIATVWRKDSNHNVQTPNELEPNNHQVALLYAQEASLESARQELRNQRDDDVALNRALQASRNENASEIDHEKTMIEKAIALSQEQERTMQQEEARLLTQVLEESQRAMMEESKRKESEDERLLRQALKESELEVKIALEDEKNDEDDLKEALSRSLQDVCPQPAILSDEEEERMIQEAIAISLEYQY